MKTTAFIATSLDGFIAREDDEIDWLESSEETEETADEDYGFSAFMDTVDVLVMGRNTFDKVLTFNEWIYGEKQVMVLTNRPLDIPKHLTTTVDSMAGPPAQVAEQLAKRGANHLYIDGGKTILGFLKAGLLDRIIITRLPVLFGTGIPLFGPVSGDIQLRHIKTQSYPSGLVQSEYEVGGKV